ncbi:MAG: leucine--tRNA ligase [Candidatus Microgenomates bacterium]
MKKVTNKKKTYILGMFPYPSGEGLHVGHVRIFTACDVMARYFRMKEGSETVLSPMGWDAFGLPAENAAIKAKKIPQTMVPHNYANFKKQMQDLSLSFDWEHELSTTDPTYYAFTQWLFLKLYEKGLVYREKVPINWCPKCKTGIANEEVLSDGTHERCGTVTGKKLLPQWVMRITSYAERLLSDLDIDLQIEGKKLDSTRVGLDWPTGILEMQRNWIGKGRGLSIKFSVNEIKREAIAWTKFWETVYGVTFIVIAPEIAQRWINEGWRASNEVANYVNSSLQKSEQQRLEEAGAKTGVDTGLTVTNPVNGAKVPVWVADYVLANVGTGIVMGVPAHDERDFDFAKKYNLPKIQVVEYEDDLVNSRVKAGEISFEGEGKLTNSGEFNGLSAWGVGKEKMAEWMIEQGYAKWQTTYHLRDWVFSRQRYWGEPIPLVYCDKCGDENGVVPLTEDQLPLTLPELDSYEPTDTGESPLSRVESWVNTRCPRCGGAARRETDTMPNWAGSCWYFLAYPWWKSESTKHQAQNSKQIQNLSKQTKTTTETLAEYKRKSKTPISDFWKEVAKPAIDEWLPADWYLGGAEHAVLHLLYARFWIKVFLDLGLVDFPEPFLRLRSVGMVLAEDGKKMSKSLGNVVNPDDMVAKYGSDATRMYEMFMGPWEQSIAWDSGAISGQVRFLGRILDTAKQEGKIGEKTSPLLAVKLKALVERVEDGVLNQKFNTAIAGLMEFVNAWRVEGVVISQEHLGMFATLLSLFAPHTAQSLWLMAQSEEKGEPDWVWPDVSKIRAVDAVMVKIAVQVNGKVRGVIEVESEKSKIESEVVALALADERVKKWVVGEVKKIIFIPGKLVSLVV